MMTRRSAAETRTRIIDAAVDLIEESGVAGLSVAEVTRQAGVSRTAFYRQFPDLHALVAEILESIGHELLASSGAWLNDPASVGRPDVIHGNLLGYAMAYARHGRLLGALTDAAGVDEQVYRIWRGLLQQFIDAQAAAIARDQANGAVRADLDPYATAYALGIAGERLSADLMGRHPRGGAEDFARIMTPIWTAVLFGVARTEEADHG